MTEYTTVDAYGDHIIGWDADYKEYVVLQDGYRVVRRAVDLEEIYRWLKWLYEDEA